MQYTQGTAEKLPYQSDAFDLIIANFVLEHVRDFPRAIDEIACALKPRGYLYMAVPNARSFEDALYRALYVGGGHLQRHSIESVIATVYGRTALKLIAYNEWPAGFTFLEDREALRALVDQFAVACREALQVDIRASSNYLFVFQRQEGIGRRVTGVVCGYCGAGVSAAVDAAEVWTCPVCGRHNGGYRREDAADERLDADMRALWTRYPHLYPALATSNSYPTPFLRVIRRGKRLGQRILRRLRRGV